MALIVPHAGYIYSGKTAALGYKLVQGSDFETVVILGPTHRVDFRGASIWPEGAFETPLGSAEVDAEAARVLAKATGFRFVPEAHEQEHSVEVQVPFIQRALPKARIVPVVMGRPEEATLKNLAAGLAELAKTRRILVVASTDMSHFLPKTDAAAEDASTLALVKDRKTAALLRLVEKGENILCGGAPVLTALYYAERMGHPSVDILGRADSTEGGGPADRVVGYFAAAISAAEEAQDTSLTDEQKKELLTLARRTLESFLRDGSLPALPTSSPIYAEPRGAFVTLTKNGDLRGCIGYAEPVLPLARAVQQCAVYAATEDPRFTPVTARELKELKIEISVLTPARRIEDVKQVEVGKHGLDPVPRQPAGPAVCRKWPRNTIGIAKTSSATPASRLGCPRTIGRRGPRSRFSKPSSSTNRKGSGIGGPKRRSPSEELSWLARSPCQQGCPSPDGFGPPSALASA